MKKSWSVLVAVLFVAAAVGISVAGSRGKMELKAGDEIFACNCGDSCPCQTLSKNAGQCTCGKDLVKAKVVSVAEGKAMLKAEGWEKERDFALAAKFACACPPECPCETQSQKEGKCTCGKAMEAVKGN